MNFKFIASSWIKNLKHAAANFKLTQLDSASSVAQVASGGLSMPSGPCTPDAHSQLVAVKRTAKLFGNLGKRKLVSKLLAEKTD